MGFFFLPHEHQVLDLMASGYTNAEIAEKLGLTEEQVNDIEQMIKDTAYDYLG